METQSARADGSLIEQLIGSALFGEDASLTGASLFHFPGRSGLAGGYQGSAAVEELLNRLDRMAGGTLAFVPSRVIADEDSTRVMLSRVRARRSGRALDTDAVHIVTASQGEIREIWLLHSDQALVDGFWSGEIGLAG